MWVSTRVLTSLGHTGTVACLQTNVIKMGNHPCCKHLPNFISFTKQNKNTHTHKLFLLLSFKKVYPKFIVVFFEMIHFLEKIFFLHI